MKKMITKCLLTLAIIGITSGCSKTPDRTIEFVTNDGTPVSTLIGRPGQAIEDEIVTTREGYKFLGWYSDSELTNRVSSIVSFPYADVTLYAKWGKIVFINFQTNGGSAKATIDGVEGENIDLGEDPTKENFYFTNWYTSSSLSEETLFNLEVFPDNDLTLHAGWEAYPTITFKTNYIVEGQTLEYIIPSISVDKGADLAKVIFPTELANLSELDDEDINVEFAGWFIEETDEGGLTTSTQFYLNGTMPDHSITLIGRWNTLRKITFVTNIDGVNLPDISAYSGHEIKVPDRPNNPGYYFEGWFEKGADDSLFDTPFDFSVMPDRDVILYASWTLNPIATFIDGFNIDYPDVSTTLVPNSNISFDIGTKVLAPSSFYDAHDGYTLIGWFTKDEATGEYDRYRLTGSDNHFVGDKAITLYARYAKTTATVSFYDPNDISQPISSVILNYTDPTDLSVSSLNSNDCPSIENKVIVDWYTGYEAGEFVGNPVSYPFTTDRDISLYAKTVDEVTLTLRIGEDIFTLTGGATFPVTLTEEIKAAYDSFIANNGYASVNWFISEDELITTNIYDLKVFPDTSMTLVLGEGDTPFNPDIEL